MKAIQTKYLNPTDTKGGRIKASCGSNAGYFWNQYYHKPLKDNNMNQKEIRKIQLADLMQDRIETAANDEGDKRSLIHDIIVAEHNTVNTPDSLGTLRVKILGGSILEESTIEKLSKYLEYILSIANPHKAGS